MADKKISQLTAKGSKIASTDRVPIAQDNGGGTFATKYVTGAEINEVLLDTSPQLGGDLDVNGNKITSASNGNIKIEPNGTGAVLIGGNDDQPSELRFMELLSNGSSYVGFKAPNDIITSRVYTLPTADGTNGQVLSTNGTGTLSWETAGGGLTIGTTAITSGTVGRILFEGTGNVIQEDSSLFWDNTNKRLGVGATPSTSVRLDIRAQGALSTDIAFRVRNSADTQNLMSIAGNGGFKIGLDNAYHISLDPTSPSLRGQNGATVAWQLSPWTGEHSWLTNNATNQNLIGIGTTSPSDKLHIYNTVNDYRIRIAVGASNPADESCGIRFTTTWAGTSFGGDAANLVVRTKGTNNINTQRTTLEFRMNSLGTSALRASLTSQSNLLLQAPTEDTNDVGVIYIPNGTAPTSGITDGYKQYSADITAGNAAPHFRTENGAIVKVYQETTAVAAATLVGNAGTNITDTDTFDGYTIGQVVKALRNLGILA